MESNWFGLVGQSGHLGRAHRSHRWGAGVERAQWAKQRNGGVLSKGASQAAARRGWKPLWFPSLAKARPRLLESKIQKPSRSDHCEVDRSKRSAARPQVRVLLRPLEQSRTARFGSLLIQCAGHGAHLTGESPVAGIYRQA